MPTAMPTSSTIDEVVLPTGSQRLGMASSEIGRHDRERAGPAAAGCSAAISAPNTTSSSTSVTGIEVTSARRKSALMVLSAWPGRDAGLPGLAHQQAGVPGLDRRHGAFRGADRLVGVVRLARPR